MDERWIGVLGSALFAVILIVAPVVPELLRRVPWENLRRILIRRDGASIEFDAPRSAREERPPLPESRSTPQ